MNKTISLTAKALVVAGAVVAFSAQSASAHSEIPKSDKGRSCWAHSRHKDHKHSVGHSHHDCGKSPATSTTVPAASTGESVVIVVEPEATRTDSSASSASAPTTGGSEVVAAPTPASETNSDTPAIADSPATPPAGDTSNPDTAVSNPTTPRSPAVETSPVVESSPASDVAAPSPRSATSESDKALVAMPSSGVGFEFQAQPINGDGAQPTASNVVDDAGTGSAFSWWWLLILLAIAAETYRRYRRARQNRETVVDGIAIA